MRHTFVVSILVHTLVIAWLWFSVDHKPLPEPPLEIEIKEVPEAETKAPDKTRARRAQKSSASASTSSSPQSWTRLKPTGDFGFAQNLAHPPSWTTEDTSGWSPEQWGSGGGSGFVQMKHTLSFDKLAVEIDGMLNYPGALARRDLEGTVNARLVFAAASHCDWQRTTISGPRYFQIYILALLKKLCSLETVEHIPFPTGQIVDLSFRFSIDEQIVRDPESKVPGRIAGNVLMFTRISQRLPLQYHVGPLTGSFLMPMVALDWPWVVEHWDTWVEGKDPLREFRDSD